VAVGWGGPLDLENSCRHVACCTSTAYSIKFFFPMYLTPIFVTLTSLFKIVSLCRLETPPLAPVATDYVTVTRVERNTSSKNCEAPAVCQPFPACLRFFDFLIQLVVEWRRLRQYSYVLRRADVRFPTLTSVFLVSIASRQVLGPTQPPIQSR
jgi:hypothetical protein